MVFVDNSLDIEDPKKRLIFMPVIVSQNVGKKQNKSGDGINLIKCQFPPPPHFL